MWDALVDHARQNGVKLITGTTHVDNKVMRSVLVKQRRVEEYVMSRFGIGD